MRGSKLGRYVVATSLVLVLGAPAVAVGFGEGKDVVGGKRNPAGSQSRGYSSETEIVASNGTYGTRQSNKRDGDGGGAIYGCRSNPGNEACIRSNNLKGGRAFEFSTVGAEAGFIQVGNPAGAPFQTNATGLVKNLNAEKVGGKTTTDLDDAQTLEGKKAADFASAGDLQFAAVSDANGTVTAGGDATGATYLNGTYSVTFKTDVSKCSFTATSIGTAQALGVEPPTTGAPTIAKVNLSEPVAPATAFDRTSFHLQVIC